jgi:subtilisin family serine protease
MALSLWTVVLGCGLFVLPLRGGPGTVPAAPTSSLSGTDAAQEPPPEKTIWDRVSAGASSLLYPRDTQSIREAIAHAAGNLGVPDWHRAGFRGQGVKVAILDSGFKGYRAALGKALPSLVKWKSFRKDGKLDAKESQHGILCAEVIHHLAPQAELLLANWEPEQPEQFLEAVRWARREGAQIISCSNIMPTWSDGEGGGPIHAALQTTLGHGNQRGDSLFIASAGNTALRHWAGVLASGNDGWHQWTRGKKDNAIRPLSQDRVSVEVYSDSKAGFELVVHDTTANREIGVCRSSRASGGIAEVRFMPQPGHRYAARLRGTPGDRSADPGPGRFHMTVLGGKLHYSTRMSSIPFPGDGREVIAVGAVDEHGDRHSYSSCGPNRHCPKPDLVATVPFPSEWRPHQPFSGTSAAAPQAAALAALVWSRYPDWTAERVRLALRVSALSTTTGHCVEKGFGLLRMPGARRAVPATEDR